MESIIMIYTYKLFEIVNVPEVRQSTNYTCGPSVMLSILGSYNIESREDKLSKLMNTNKNGTEFSGFIKVAEKYNIPYKYDSFAINDIKSFIDNEFPCIIALQAWSKNPDTDYTKSFEHGHYVIPISYDDNKIYFEDPSIIGLTYLDIDEFQKRWHSLGEDNKEKKYNEAIVFLKKPIKIKKIIYMEDNNATI